LLVFRGGLFLMLDSRLAKRFAAWGGLPDDHSGAVGHTAARLAGGNLGGDLIGARLEKPLVASE
jgi:hypothetical protein